MCIRTECQNHPQSKICFQNELESSIMLSRPPSTHPDIPPSRRGFGLTLLTHTRNPSQLARALYLAPNEAPHVFLSGTNAEKIGETFGIETVDESYFFTENRWREHRRGLGLPEEPFPHPGGEDREGHEVPLDQLPTGTVGAVALDVRGCVAAVTSTGGRTNKLVGRIGDTPSMGSGFWAEEWTTKGWARRVWNAFIRRRGKNVAVGVSGTGDGDVRRFYQFCWFVSGELRVFGLVLHQTQHRSVDCPSYEIPP